LTDLPSEVAADVLRYHSDYIADALSAGLEPEQILRRLGSPEQILAATRDELAIEDALRKVGPLGLLRTSRRLIGRGLSRAARSVALALLSLAPLLAAVCFYLSAAVLLLGGLASGAAVLYNLALHRAVLAGIEIAGQVGLAVFLTAACLGLAWLFWLSGQGFARATLLLLRKIANKQPPTGLRTTAAPAGHKPVRRYLTVALAVFLLAGFTLSALADLPQTYWRLWNSQKPADVRLETVMLDEPVDRLSLVLLNTDVTLRPSDGPQGRLIYEKLSYVDLVWRLTDGVLTLEEQSNGRLPFFHWLSIHRGTTSLILDVPLAAAGSDLDIRTISGFVEVDLPCRQATIRTSSGDITVRRADLTDNLDLVSDSGRITVVPVTAGGS
jgi:uncharacterized membrane protein